jgi:hypothetical protein
LVHKIFFLFVSKQFKFVSVVLTQVLNTETNREIYHKFWFHETNRKIATDCDSVLFVFFDSRTPYYERFIKAA